MYGPTVHLTSELPVALFAALPTHGRTPGSTAFLEAGPTVERSGPGDSAAPRPLNNIAEALTDFATDFVSAGVGAMRNEAGPHTITPSGVTGPVTGALLYRPGPTNSHRPATAYSIDGWQAPSSGVAPRVGRAPSGSPHPLSTARRGKEARPSSI